VRLDNCGEGKPADEVDRVWEEMQRLARKFYGLPAGAVPLCGVLPMYKISPTGGKLYPAETKDGKDSTGQPVRMVHLYYTWSHFTYKRYLNIPYIFLHELISHCYPPEIKSRILVEGFLLWCACQWFSALCAGAAPFSQGQTRRQLARRQLKCSEADPDVKGVANPERLSDHDSVSYGIEAAYQLWDISAIVFGRDCKELFRRLVVDIVTWNTGGAPHQFPSGLKRVDGISIS